jgi:hypothetical protein
MKPVSKATLQTIKRFPELYKRQALQVIDRETSDAIRITADSFVMASILVLIEEFGFGTSDNATRVQRFVSKLQEVIDTNAEYYDDSVAEGLHNKLSNYGIDFRMR